MSAIQLNSSLLDALYTSFQIQFKDGMQKATHLYEEIATPIYSVSSIENYPIIDQFGKMREWIGPRKVEQLNIRTLSVKNRNFEHAVRVSRNAIADEQTGLFGNLIAGLGMAAQNLWDDLVVEALTTPSEWLDGLPFFSKTRFYADNNTVTNTTADALSPESYAEARRTMLSYVGHGGIPLNVIPNLLLVGPQNEVMGKKILEMQYHCQENLMIDNPMFGTAKLVVSPRLVGSHAKKWFLLATNDVIRPVVLQQRQMPQLTRIDSPEAEHVFNHNENLYGTCARGAAALVAPHLVFSGIPA